MGAKLDNVKALYLEGIRDGNYLEVLHKFTGDTYIQHSTGVPDGIDGIEAMFEPFMARYPDRDIQIKRGFEDDNLVFIHVYQNLNNGEAEWVTMDVFKMDDRDRVIEHWDIIAPFAKNPENPFGAIDGVIEISDAYKTDQNKATVREFAKQVLVRHDFAQWDRFVRDADFAGHDQSEDGSASAWKQQVQARRYDTPFHLIGQGDFVLIYSKVTRKGDDWAEFDLFRLQDDKIVEHWQNGEVIGPRDQWNNSGKF